MATVLGLDTTEYKTGRRTIKLTYPISGRWAISSKEHAVAAPDEHIATMTQGAATDSIETILQSDTITHSLVSLYVAQVARFVAVERVFWRKEDARIRVWTLMSAPDEDVENEISGVELAVMDLLPDINFDFSVIFRQGKPSDHFGPLGAVSVYAKA
jgi:hypothetical protein